MNVQKMTPKKNRAQAMVEFAIVLPILLMLLYGILEAGRLLFIYSTVVTASRQAVRYGSATGQGQVSTTVPRYQDCAGIRQAAQRVDFLNAFEDSDIVIQYDTGPGSQQADDFCGGNPVTSLPAFDTGFDPGTNNGRRLLVTIDGDYLPIVPRIVGFLERSDAKSNPIKAQSARTVLVSVAIFVTAPPQTYTPSTPTWTPSPIATPTFTPSNTPTLTATLTPIVSNTPSVTPTLTLSPTATLTLTRTNTPTQSFTPSPTPTRVSSCNSSHGTIALSGNTMTMTITNPNAFPLTVADLFVVWNHDKGHQAGNDKTLTLLSAQLLPNSTPFWTGSNPGPSTTIDPAAALTIPASGSSTIVFTFHQSYDTADGSEEILINLSNPGCEGYPIHEKN